MAYRDGKGKHLIQPVMSHTEINVPGRKNSVTRVMIFIDTVSVLVFRAISFISTVICSMLIVDALDSRAKALLLCAFWKSNILWS